MVICENNYVFFLLQEFQPVKPYHPDISQLLRDPLRNIIRHFIFVGKIGETKQEVFPSQLKEWPQGNQHDQTHWILVTSKAP